jgi:shikimate kinase
MDGHLWLIGMMGAGKSTVGQELAERMSRPFVDVDDEVTSQAGRSIAELWNDNGEHHFRALEAAAVERIADGPPAVIATGGGVVLDQSNVTTMRSSGRVVWLAGRVATLERRVGSGTGRPLLAAGDAADHLAALLDTRREHYGDAADVTIDTDDRTIEAIVDQIEAWWNGS